MILGFKRRFESAIVDGSKRHTIRANSNRKWRVGMIADCYVDPRQETMRLLGRWPVTKIEKIRMWAESDHHYLSISIDGVLLSPDEANEFAWRDGFRDLRPVAALELMTRFWRQTHGYKRDGALIRSVDFYGIVIHWDYDRPVPSNAVRINKENRKREIVRRKPTL